MAQVLNPSRVLSRTMPATLTHFRSAGHSAASRVPALPVRMILDSIQKPVHCRARRIARARSHRVQPAARRGHRSCRHFQRWRYLPAVSRVPPERFASVWRPANFNESASLARWREIFRHVSRRVFPICVRSSCKTSPSRRLRISQRRYGCSSFQYYHHTGIARHCSRASCAQLIA